MSHLSALHIGTCSWKYDSWRGLVYPEQGPIDYLREYSRHYATVEVDQWFWSLFQDDRPVLPKAAVVRDYLKAVPGGFTFCIKVPNSITLTHHYSLGKSRPPAANRHFLSIELMHRFLEAIEPLAAHLGPLIFQFEYLNRQKMPDLETFMERFGRFKQQLPTGFDYCVEIRNPNYLTGRYFDFLAKQDLHHVFLQGYYMPPIFEVYHKHRDRLGDLTVIRLHGPDRKEMEKLTGKSWDRIVAPKDQELVQLAAMLRDLASRKVQINLYVNNHFEGSAPRTISRIVELLQ